MKITTKRRWLRSVLKEAQEPHIAMPWERRTSENGWKNRTVTVPAIVAKQETAQA